MKIIRVVSFAVFAVGFGGCAVELHPAAFESVQPEMRPASFFEGTTHSSGVLENRSGEPTRQLHVEGHGVRLPDGTLKLEQMVRFDQDPAERRTWVLRQVDRHRYVASLTDASGAVDGEAWGNVFHLTYSMKKPLGGTVEQWMYLQPDGRTIVNEATVRVLGIVVAHLSERITHEDP